MNNLFRTLSIAAILAISLAGCTNSPSAEKSKTDTTATASDTITNVTNPGVGSAADDTLSKP